jgi:hypothetical protein
MNPNITETIRLLDEDMARLRAVRDGLQAWACAGLPEPVPTHPTPPATTPTPRPKPAKPSNIKDGSRRAALEAVKRLQGIVAKLPEPITTVAVMKAAGCTDRQANGALWRWENRNKWLKRVSVGQYVRTAKWPQNGAPTVETKRVTIPGLDEPTLAEKLATAEAELAAAKEHGHDTLAKILTAKVEHLKAKIEA